MTFKLIRPYQITPSNLTTSVFEEGVEYSATATYAEGDVVQWTVGDDATHHRYESVSSGNIGHTLDNDTYWLDLGATNRWAMFDQVNGTQTESTDGIDVLVEIEGQISVAVDVEGRIDSIALFGLEAEWVQVIVNDHNGVEVYNEDFSLLSQSGVDSWFAYFSEPIAYDTEFIRTGLPLNANPVVEVVIESISGVVACGTMVVGRSIDLGGTLYGARGGIADYSRKTTDDFGNTSLVARSYAKRTSYKLALHNTRVDAVFDVLAEVRATPCVWIGSTDFRMTWSYGWATDWGVEITYPLDSYVTLEIEGLT